MHDTLMIGITFAQTWARGVSQRDTETQLRVATATLRTNCSKSLCPEGVA